MATSLEHVRLRLRSFATQLGNKTLHYTTYVKLRQPAFAVATDKYGAVANMWTNIFLESSQAGHTKALHHMVVANREYAKLQTLARELTNIGERNVDAPSMTTVTA